ncbi:MAG: hypothetical protein GWM92_13535 [Gemmatimonadetes bacterium]|nr:hypothetical protein [Gemmatimonadota bacterium]NIR79735.1 hypothetical protein [Gemmatimonadota bacterium]NIT88439.1 hypothetical protein [Gemmatimonadota bacterium]NIU32254.1 hypothetical protein [Gemmatimonadota bacterium]NIU36795.1 hypothetical protein [Gemmatimonadota bacterium]
MILDLDLRFHRDLDAAAVARAIDRIEKRIRDEHPEVAYVFVEVESITRRVEGEDPTRPPPPAPP